MEIRASVADAVLRGAAREVSMFGRVDVTPSTMQVDDKTTLPFPITDHAADITAIMQPAMDAVLSGRRPASR